MILKHSYEHNLLSLERHIDVIKTMNTHTSERLSYPYEKPSLEHMQAHVNAAKQQQEQQACILHEAWAKTPAKLNADAKHQAITNIQNLLTQHNAVMVAHYYVEPELQDLALATGGMVGDSLEMARFGQNHSAQTLLVAGVKFMGETSKILSPEKTVLMPDLEATCSLDLGCPVDEFTAFCDQYPDRTVVVYANTSAEVKARADWVVTSSIALEIVTFLHSQGKKIIWGPDRHLGSYIQKQTGADMILWQGSCIVHHEFKGLELSLLKEKHPEALVLVHPESPAEVVAQADVIGSTSKLLQAAVHHPATSFIVATDQGILHEMQKQAPHKQFFAAPTAGDGATCKSCAFCPWMAMNGLQNCISALEDQSHAVQVPNDILQAARRSIQRMLDFSTAYREFGAAADGANLNEHIAQFQQWLEQNHEHAQKLL